MNKWATEEGAWGQEEDNNNNTFPPVSPLIVKYGINFLKKVLFQIHDVSSSEDEAEVIL